MWEDKAKTNHQTEACRKYWLLHYGMLAVDPTELEQCVFKPTGRYLGGRTVGSLQISVFGSVAYNHLTSSTSLTLTIERDAVTDFPIDLSTEKFVANLKLPTSSKHTFSFKPQNQGSVNGLTVKLNYTGIFQQFILAIRIQTLENVICPPTKDLHPLDVAHVYTLDNNVSDVYLSRLYPYRGAVVKLIDYTGYYQGSCRALVKGQTCSQTSSYNIIRIHHLPTISISINGAQEIQISTKRTSDCSFHCPLNVAIWEITKCSIANKVQLRYHECMVSSLSSDMESSSCMF